MTDVKAVFEQGVLRPLSPLPLREHQEVTITIADGPEGGQPDDDLFDTEFLQECRAEGDTGVSLDAVRHGLSKIRGSLAEDIRAERDER
jgi:predicted DNA-binding antitoxin AbrB/MazE fold protein